ncbi:MAG: hypothetical protein JRI30_03555 [Deltaproteobacteria bacterium]|nr:hypothetical protein [Deltaproteobacteria bacterium]
MALVKSKEISLVRPMSMGMSFFNHALTKTSREAASHQCTRTKFLEDNDELLVHRVLSGTLMPNVRGHDVKKDIPMLIHQVIS